MLIIIPTQEANRLLIVEQLGLVNGHKLNNHFTITFSSPTR